MPESASVICGETTSGLLTHGCVPAIKRLHNPLQQLRFKRTTAPKISDHGRKKGKPQPLTRAIRGAVSRIVMDIYSSFARGAI